jgi:hypothetical protein
LEIRKATLLRRGEAGMSVKAKAALIATNALIVTSAHIATKMTEEPAEGVTSSTRERTSLTSGGGTAVGTATRKGTPRRRAVAGSIGDKDRTIARIR